MDAAVGEAADLGTGDVADERSRRADDRSGRRSGSDRRLLAGLLVAVNLPIVVATTRALARGWQPLADNGILLVRARDVGTSHHPLLGTWTSASLVLDTDLNNPGPLYFDVIAPAIRLLGPWVGLAVGVMLVNMAASSLAVVAARRISGVESMVAVAIAVIGLQWVLGSELLFDVWQPNALVLPLMAFLVVTACLATGDLVMAPWFVGLGSLLVQTHMSHLPLVAALTVAAAIVAGWTIRHADERPRWRRPLVWTAVVALLCWVQPLIEQVTGRGQGNMSRIAEASAGGGGTETIGLSRALRLMAEVTVQGPWFTRSSYASAVPLTPPGQPLSGVVSLGPAVLVVTVTIVVLVALAVACWRSGRRPLATMAGVSVTAIIVGLVALAWSPLNVLGIAVHQMRWLWPVAAMATAAVTAIALSAVRSRPALRQRSLAVGAGLVAFAALALLPTFRSSGPSPVTFAPDLEAAQELVGQLDGLEGRGTVLIDLTGLRFNEPYSGLVFAELQDRGIPFVFDNEVYIRQFGEGRRHDGDAALRMWQVEGPDAVDPPPGAERVAFVEDASAGPLALLVEPID